MIGDGKPEPVTNCGRASGCDLGSVPGARRRRTIARDVSRLPLHALRLLRSRRAVIGVVQVGLGLPKSGEVFRLDLCGLSVFAPDGVVDFFSVDADRFRGGDAESHLVATDVDDGDFDVVADNDRLVLLTGQYQHCWLLPGQRGLNPRFSARLRVTRRPCPAAACGLSIGCSIIARSANPYAPDLVV